MTKVNFLNQAESFMSESYISQLHSMHIKKQNVRVLYLGSNEKKNSGKDPNKIEARFAEGKQKIYSSKIKIQKPKPKQRCQYFI